MGRKPVLFNPKVTIRFVPYKSNEQRQLLHDQFQRTFRQAKEAKRCKEQEAIGKSSQIDDQQEKTEFVPACGPLADCPLVPILQRCTHLRQALQKVL